jgi:hypothetical protein
MSVVTLPASRSESDQSPTDQVRRKQSNLFFNGPVDQNKELVVTQILLFPCLHMYVCEACGQDRD